MGSLIALAMLNYRFGGGGVVEDGGEEGEVGDGASGGGSCGMRCLIKLTTPLGEARMNSSSLSHAGEIRGLFPKPRYLGRFFRFALLQTLM